MNNRFKKALALFLTIVMLLIMLPTSVFADGTTKPIPVAEETSETIEESSGESTEKSTEEYTEEPAEETTEEFAEEYAEEPAEETTEEAIKELINEPTIEPVVSMFAIPRMLSTTSSDEQLNIARKGTLVEGNTITIVWNEMTGVDHYEITVKDETAESYPCERKSVGTSRSFVLEGLLANHTYKVWVGAVCPGFEAMGIPKTHQDSMTFTIEVAEEEAYDELVVSIEDPGEVIVGDSLIVRSDVSGGSGEYSYSWKWTHPNGTEITDTNKNVRIFETVKGEYTFVLTVTDEVTSDVCTTKKKIVKVGSDEEEYDPMNLSLMGPADEVELAEASIRAKCSVIGGSGIFEYGWTIYLNGAKYKEFSYGTVEDTYILALEKTGVYTISVTVHDLETNLTETASCSTTVVQKEYDPLTVEITSAPKCADINEAVSIKAISTGGYGDVVTSYEVFLGNTCVAHGSGLEFSFVPSSEGKYKVVVQAEDDAQCLQDIAEILVGKLVKCSVSVSSAEVHVGDTVTATIAVTDGTGPFSYDWMLYLDDAFVSSDLNSEKTSFIWTAERAGTYRIEGTCMDEGKEELIGELSFDSDSKNVVSKAAIVTPELTANKSEIMVGDSVTFTATNIDTYTEVYLYAEDYKLATLTASQNTYTETFSLAGERTIILKDAENNALCSVKVIVEQLGELSAPVLTAASPQKIEDGLRVSWTKVDHADKYILMVKCPDGTTNTYEYAGDITAAIVTDFTQTGICDVWMLATGYGYSQSQSDSVTVVIENAVPIVKPADPVVKVSVEGTTMLANWEAVDGAASYVYSVRDLDTDDLVREYADGNSRTITLELEAGKKYRLAVAAVPAGVDPRTQATLCGWHQVDFETADEEKLGKPNVKVTVDGLNMVATWSVVEGANRYVFSLRDTSKTEPEYKHVETDGCSISLTLEAGVEYKLAVAAVPAEVNDTVAETTKCSWTEVVFKTETVEEMSTPKVLAVESNVNGVLAPGSVVSVKVICNEVTALLDVYDENNPSAVASYTTLRNPVVDADGKVHFDYTTKYAANGKYQLRFVALTAQAGWSDNVAHQGFVDVVVCDHVAVRSKDPVSTVVEKKNNDSTHHYVVKTYSKICVCGKVSETETVRDTVDCNWTINAGIQSKHESNGRHLFFNRCKEKICNNAHTNNNYVKYLASCSTCQTIYGKDALAKGSSNNTKSRIKELQKLLMQNGYDLPKYGADGNFSGETTTAVEKFQKDHGLNVTGVVDDATMQALRNGVSADTEPKGTVNQEEEQPAVDEAVSDTYLQDFVEKATQPGTELNKVYSENILSNKDDMYNQLVDSVIKSYTDNPVHNWSTAAYKTLTDFFGTAGDVISGDTFMDDMVEETEVHIKDMLLQHDNNDLIASESSQITSTASTFLNVYVALKDKSMSNTLKDFYSTAGNYLTALDLALKAGDIKSKTDQELLMIAALATAKANQQEQLQKIIEFCGSDSVIGKAACNVLYTTEKEYEKAFKTEAWHDFSTEALNIALSSLIDMLGDNTITYKTTEWINYSSNVMNVAGGILLGGEVGGFLTQNTGRFIDAKERMILLSAIGAITKTETRHAFTKEDEALYPLTTLHLLVQDAGVKATQDCVNSYGDSLFNVFNAQTSQNVASMKEGLSDIRLDIMQTEEIISNESGNSSRNYCAINGIVDTWVMDYGAGERIAWVTLLHLNGEGKYFVVNGEFEGELINGQKTFFVRLTDQNDNTYVITREDYLKHSTN